jgi:hypothetical protein
VESIDAPDLRIRLCSLFVNIVLNQPATLTFTRSFSPVTVSYVLNGIVLERVNTMIDLGVILDSKLSFREHIDSVVNKGSAMLGFINRLSREFRDPYRYTLKVLFVTNDRSKLEYTPTASNNPFMSLISTESIEYKRRRIKGFNEYAGLFEFGLTRDIFLNRLRTQS